MTDRIEKHVELKAPVSRVWRALTDHREFGSWFRVRIDGPFVVGEVSSGNITHPGYEHLRWNAVIRAMEPERLFAFDWHPYAIDPDRDYGDEPITRVEFRLAPVGGGTRLTVIESGFDKLPPERREEAYRMNEGGWEAQMRNIEAHVAAS